MYIVYMYVIQLYTRTHPFSAPEGLQAVQNPKPNSETRVQGDVANPQLLIWGFLDWHSFQVRGCDPKLESQESLAAELRTTFNPLSNHESRSEATSPSPSLVSS